MILTGLGCLHLSHRGRPDGNMPDDDKRTQYDFPHCMHVFAAAMHMKDINPAEVTITLPVAQWWKLYSALESQFPGLMRFDGRGELESGFHYMGFRFVAERAKPKLTKVA
jgi:hypothetical protein